MGLATEGTPAQAQSCTTTITGKVFAPNAADPLPNILVYVPTTPVLPFTTQGPGTCANPAAVVSGNPLVATTTGYDGSFSLTNPALAGSNVTLVVQAGKWRRQYTGLNVPACQTTSITTAMPANKTQGDLPRIAISTGSADALECILRSNKMGISDSEFTAPSGTGSVNLYAGAFSAGVTHDASGTVLPSEATLVDNPAALDSYDLTIFACQGGPSTPASNPAAAVVQNQQNVVDYANLGGRVFATHYSYIWLNNSTIFKGVANWITDEAINPVAPATSINATIDQTYPEGQTLAKWLNYIGATPTLGQIPLQATKVDQKSVNPPTQSWLKLNYSDSKVTDPVMQFTFDTPINAVGTPTIALNFTNNPVTFLQNDPADTITIDVTDTNATAPADASLNLTVTLPNGFTALSMAGGPGTGWVCSPATLVCNRTQPLAGGATDSISLVVSVGKIMLVGGANVTATISGGGISGTSQCGRVLFNEYHVETVSSGNTTFPKECSSAVMTAQEKFLEFSLYNLSNFVAPVSTDTITVQAQPLMKTLVTSPEPSDYAGAFSISETLLPPAGAVDVTGTVNFSIDGVSAGTATVANSAASLQVPALVYTLLTPGSHVISATYSGDVNYPTSTLTTTHTVNREPTTTTLVPLTPTSPTTLYYGQLVDGTYSVLYSIQVGNSIPTGNILVYDGATLVCTVPYQSPCPYGSPTLLDAGVHPITVAFAGDTNYGPSSSSALTFTVLPDITSAILTGGPNPAHPGDTVTFTVTLAGNFATPTGTVTFYDGSTAIGQGVLNANGVATITTTTLTLGSHPVTAVFQPTLDFNGVTSNPVYEEIIPVTPPLASSLSLTSSLNPSPHGTNVVFTAHITAYGAFVTVPSGVISFLDGTSVLGTGTLDANGTAVFQTATLAAGSHAMTASYAGQAAVDGAPPRPPSPPRPVGSQPLLARTIGSPPITGSVSPVLTQVVLTPLTAATSGFSMSISPVPFTVAAGLPGTLQVSVETRAGFNQQVALSCSGLPANTTCTFVTPTMSAAGGATTLYVLPKGPSSCGAPSTPYYGSSHGFPLLPLGVPLVAGLGFVMFPQSRRKLGKALAIAAVTGAIWLSGCGACTNLGVWPGSYTFTVTATPLNGPITQAQSLKVGMQVLLP